MGQSVRTRQRAKRRARHKAGLTAFGGALLLMSCGVAPEAEFDVSDTALHPPLAPVVRASQEEFNTVSSVCTELTQRNEDDVHFGFSAAAVFYRSTSNCQTIEGKDFCPTFMVSNVRDEAACKGMLLTRGEPVYGARKVPGTSGDEVIVLRVPAGRVAVDQELTVFDY